MPPKAVFSSPCYLFDNHLQMSPENTQICFFNIRFPFGLVGFVFGTQTLVKFTKSLLGVKSGMFGSSLFTSKYVYDM